MDQLILSDAQWARLADLIPGEGERLFVEPSLRLLRINSPWRNLPAAFDRWSSVFRRSVVAGVFERVFKVLRNDPDFEYITADGPIVFGSAGV